MPKNKKKFKDLKELAEGKLSAKVYDENGELKEESKKVRVEGKGSISAHKKAGGSWSWKQKKRKKEA